MIRGSLGRNLVGSSPSWIGDLLLKLKDAGLTPKSIIDVGANEGQTILDVFTTIGSAVPITGFEANPALAVYTRDMLARNDVRNATVVPVGLSDRCTVVTLEGVSENDTAASIVTNLRPSRNAKLKQYVPVYTLDSLVKDGVITVPDSALIKIDVEGAELEVISGAEDVLRTKRPLVLCEVLWASGTERLDFMTERNRLLMAKLNSAEYVVYRVKLDSTATTFLGLEAMSRFPSSVFIPLGQEGANSHQCDYLFLPVEREEEIAQAVLTQRTP